MGEDTTSYVLCFLFWLSGSTDYFYMAKMDLTRMIETKFMRIYVYSLSTIS